MVKLSQKHLFEDVLESLEDRFRRINEDRKQLDSESASVEEQIAGIRAQLNGLSKSASRGPSTRVPRGSVRVKVMEFLRDFSGQSTIKEIADATGQNLGSVRSILKRDSQFMVDKEGHWYFVREQAAPDGEPS